tara:strand:- start:1622 stop:2044 length:423 start_codon:yes stop_codon:yes gene_type:complete
MTTRIVICEQPELGSMIWQQLIASKLVGIIKGYEGDTIWVPHPALVHLEKGNIWVTARTEDQQWMLQLRVDLAATNLRCQAEVWPNDEDNPVHFDKIWNANNYIAHSTPIDEIEQHMQYMADKVVMESEDVIIQLMAANP